MASVSVRPNEDAAVESKYGSDESGRVGRVGRVPTNCSVSGSGVGETKRVRKYPSNLANLASGRVCHECGGPRHGTVLENRERAARLGLEGWIRSLHRDAWERFGDLFAFDLNALMAKLPGSIVLRPEQPEGDRARCIGVACEWCDYEEYNGRTATRAKKGIDYPCPKCGAEYGLFRVYSGVLRENEVIRILFPWSGARSASSSSSTSPSSASSSTARSSTSPGGTG